jgi:polar amino acid transport system substrate-binding protein
LIPSPFARTIALFVALLALLGQPALAQDTLDSAKKAGQLIWGADQEGGAPFIFPSEQDQEVLIGFEVEMAEKMSALIGTKITFQQSQWDALPSMLQARKVDFIMNGYEWMPDRVADMETSIPYYVYALQLEVRDEGPITTWEQLKALKPDGSKWKAGVLSGSAAEEYLKEKDFADTVELASYDGVTDSMREVETGKIDLTLQDTPIANYYAKDFKHLRFVEAPVAPGYYVIYARKGDKALIEAINSAIITMYRNRDLERIYSKYGMWDDNQRVLGDIIDHGKFFGNADSLAAPTAEEAAATAAEAGPEAPPTPEAELDFWGKFFDYAGLLGASAGMTVALSFLSFPLAVMLGMLIGLGRLYGPSWVRLPLTAYVEFLRGTPLMLQLYFIFYFLPELGVSIPAFPTAIIGLAVNYSAYESEIYRAGLQAIPPGQMEAAMSLGMSKMMALRRIIVPQAFRIVIPPVVNDFIAMFKDTSVCSVVTIVELTKRFSVLSRNNVSDLVVLMFLTGLLYLLMSYPMSLLARRIEKQLGNEVRA